MKLLRDGLLALIDFYQKIISPCLPARCRYYPTCSEYGRHALLWHGVRRGLPLLIWRICRCQPFGGSGVDFVPVPMFRYRFEVAKLSHSFVRQDTYGYRACLTHLMKN